jgi:hypothetical protein
MPHRERKLKAIVALLVISVILPSVMIAVVFLYGSSSLPSIFVLSVLAAVAASMPFHSYPRRVSVLGDGTVEVLMGLRKLRISGRVAKAMSTRDVESSLHACPVGLRISLDSFFYALCLSDFGRITVISTPGCSGTWLLMEKDKKKYLICCEEKDREKCHV